LNTTQDCDEVVQFLRVSKNHTCNRLRRERERERARVVYDKRAVDIIQLTKIGYFRTISMHSRTH
jgi:hypothetical protein